MVRVPGIALIVTCWLFWIALGVASDSTTFRISDYKPTKFVDFEWRLDGEASTASNGTVRPHVYNPRFGVGDADEYHYGTGEVEGDFTSYWHFRRETVQMQFEFSTQFTGIISKRSELTEYFDSGSFGSSDYTRYHVDYTRYRTQTTVNGGLRIYLLSDVSVSGDLAVTHEYLDYETHTDSRMESTVYYDVDSLYSYGTKTTDSLSQLLRKSIALDGNIYLGWGRVYDGEYAGTALFLIDEMRYRGLLLREPNYDEMIALTEIIREYRLKHPFDQREFRSKALTVLMAYLGDHQLAREAGVKDLLVVEDVWDHFPAPPRRYGWTLRFGFGGTDSYSSSLRNYEGEAHYFKVTPNEDTPGELDTTVTDVARDNRSYHDSQFEPHDRLVGRLDYYRPLSTRWQLNGLFKAVYNIYHNADPDYSHPQSYWETVGDWEFTLSSEWHYYHDSRHELVLNGSVYHARVTNNHYVPRFNQGAQLTHWEHSKYEYHNWKFESALGYSYRLAVATTLRVEATYLYSSDSDIAPSNTDRTHNNNLSISLGLTHWLF